MARHITRRLLVSGWLEARTPLHLGSGREDPRSDLPVAVDGMGRPYIPGTGVAGVLRGWCEAVVGCDAADRFWGPRRSAGDERTGHASFILVDDALLELPPGCPAEIRDGVGIDRWSGAAHQGVKFDRMVAPRGTRARLSLTLELDESEEASIGQGLLGNLLVALEAGDLRVGAAKSRGLGKVTLKECRIKEQHLDSPSGILDVLAGGETSVAPSALQAKMDPRLLAPRPRLAVSISWKPQAPVMVKASAAGVHVEMLPLVSADGTKLAPVILGSALKGILRGHAERIVRTLGGPKADVPWIRAPQQEHFLDQVKLAEVPLVAALFGAAAERLEDGEEAEADDRAEVSRGQGDREMPDVEPGLSALSVDDCYLRQLFERDVWEKIVKGSNDDAVVRASENAGVGRFQLATHIAIDRWTGGAADGALFNVLEPHFEPEAEPWEPFELSLDFARLGDADRLPALGLLLLVFRDLKAGRLPIGFGVNRGFGAIEVLSVTYRGHDLTREGLVELAGLDGEYGELPRSVIAVLAARWREWVTVHTPFGEEASSCASC